MSCTQLSKQVDARLPVSRHIRVFKKEPMEPPVIIDSAKTTKSLLLKYYYFFNDGYFDVETAAKL
jgi:hypothetical protein